MRKTHADVAGNFGTWARHAMIVTGNNEHARLDAVRAAHHARLHLEAQEEAARQTKEAIKAFEARCRNCYGCGDSVERVDGKLTRVPCPDCTVPYVLSRYEGFPKVTVVR